MDSERYRLHRRARAGGGGSHCRHSFGVRSYELCTCGIQRRKHAVVHGGQCRDRRKAERSARRNVRRHHGQKPAGNARPDQSLPEHRERRMGTVEQPGQYSEIRKDGRMDGKRLWTGRHCRTAEFFGGRCNRCPELRCVDERKEETYAGRSWENLRCGGLHQ